LTAYLEFKKPAEFNLAGRLVDADEKEEGQGAPLRALAKDKPVTVVMEHIHYVEYREKSRSSMTSGVPGGTVEARVGDRITVGCGEYTTEGLGKVDYRTGVVVARPFKAVAPYTPEPKKK
jgi:hypothetical protein